MEQEVRPLLNPILLEANAIEVRDQLSYDHAVRVAKKAIEMRKQITERLAPGKEAAWKAHKEWTRLEQDLLDAVSKAERIAKDKYIAWEQDQERIRLEEQRKLEAEARKRAEEEKLQAAIEAEKNGMGEDAVEKILEEEVATPAVVAPPTFERASGTSTREQWQAEVTDLLALAKHVAQNPGLLHLIQPNTTALNAMARAQKSLLHLPGVKAVMKKVASVRT